MSTQPRVPAGNPTGGQWTSSRSGSGAGRGVAQSGDWRVREESALYVDDSVPAKSRLNHAIKGSVPGTAIVGYEWKSMIADVDTGTDEGVVAKRVSDWDQSGFSTGTGREIVHHYYVKHPDGSVTLEGVRSAEKILGGITDKTTFKGMTSAVKTARGWETKIKESEGRIQKAEKVLKEIDALPRPPIVESEKGWRMGEAEVWHPSFAGARPTTIPEERERALTSSWRDQEARRRGIDFHVASEYQHLRTYQDNLKKAMKKVRNFIGGA